MTFGEVSYHLSGDVEGFSQYCLCLFICLHGHKRDTGNMHFLH